MAKASKKAAPKKAVTTKAPAAPKKAEEAESHVRQLRRKQSRLSRLFDGPQDQQAEGPHKVANVLMLTKQAAALPWLHWEIFGGILLVYILINLLLVGGVGATTGDLQSVKSSLGDVFTGHFSEVTTGFTLFAFLVSSSGGTAGGVASAYQTVLILVTSLAVIWSLRQVYSKVPIRVRDAYYNGLTPIVTFVLVMLYVGLQLVPAAVGGFAFSALVGGGVLTEWYEQVPVGVVSLGLICLSLYWFISSVFSLYIITLPGMSPMEAIRSSKNIVRGRQVLVLRKLLFLPLSLAVITTVFMVPMTLFATSIAPFVFYLITSVAIVYIHSYMYSLYRELIVE